MHQSRENFVSYFRGDTVDLMRHYRALTELRPMDSSPSLLRFAL